MSEPERTSVRLKVDDAVRIPSMVDPYLNGSNSPDLVLLQLDSEKFPRRTMDFPEDVRKYVMTHPKVKVEWNKKNIEYEFFQVNAKQNSEYIKPQNDETISEDITVGMASQPFRKEQMIRVVKQLLPQCTRICVCLNNYDSVPDELKNNPKIISVLCGEGKQYPDLGCMNKMLFCGDFPGYFAAVDDDIDYPENYIQELKKKVDYYDRQVICSLHGHVYKGITNGEINFKSRKVYNFYDKYDLDVFCHRVGMGVSMFYPSKINLNKSIFLCKPKNFGDDEIVAVWAQENHIPLIRIATTNIKVLEVKKFSLSTGSLCKNTNSGILRREFLESYHKWKLNVVSNRRRICVVSAGTKNLEFQYTITNENKRKYCQLYGYDFRFVSIEQSDKQSFHFRKTLLTDIINENKYDYVMWMDCDAWFHTYEISLDSVIDTFMKDKSLLLARDHGVINKPCFYHSCYINSGVLMFRSNDISKRIIQMWNNPSIELSEWMKLNTTLNDQPYLSILCLVDSFTRANTIVVQPKYFNTFARFGFTKSNFILHFPGHKDLNHRHQYSEQFTNTFNESVKFNNVGFDCQP